MSVTPSRQTTLKTPGGQITSLLTHLMFLKMDVQTPNHVFDTFGLFSGHTGTEVRVKLHENIAANMPFYERRSAICLQMRSMNWKHGTKPSQTNLFTVTNLA